MCIIACSENVNINWIQDIVCIEPYKKQNPDQKDVGFSTIYSTIGIEAQQQNGRIDLIFPGLKEPPKDISDSIFSKKFFLADFNDLISKQSISRTIVTDYEAKCLRVRFHSDSKYNGKEHIYWLLGDQQAKVSVSFPDQKTRKKTNEVLESMPFTVLTIDGIQPGYYILRFQYVTYPYQEISSNQYYLLRGQDIAEEELKGMLIDLRDHPDLMKDYMDRLATLLKGKQNPQLDIYAMDMKERIRYQYKGVDGVTHRPDYLVQEGGEHHVPKKGNRTLKFELIKDNPGEFENQVKVFYPVDGYFRIDLIIREKMCTLHSELWKDHVKLK
ncbi:MAG: hypothetical protein WCP08_16410 [Prolixibacteraceae bacterium]